jgi:hypothetical protein
MNEPKVPRGYTAEELERDNPHNQWMYEGRGRDPVPESADECEFGDMEYQWRLWDAGL